MGAILAKLRKEKTTYEVLEKLEQDIKYIEEYSISTQERHKRLVGNILVISIGLNVIAFIVYYFIFFPPTWMEKITYAIPLLMFPFLILLLKRIIAWYYQRKLNKNHAKLESLRAEKEKILEQVMNKETYKVALEILKRFADTTNGFKPTGTITPRVLSSQISSIQKGIPSTKKLVPTSSLKQPEFTTVPQLSTPTVFPSMPSDRIPFPKTPIVQQQSALVPRNLNQSLQVLQRRTPYPIINQQEKGVLEKMVDFLIGDGPQNRFAMICRECYAHNGMALQEEYEYATFRCAFCNTLNPSKKSRPIGPKLPTVTQTYSRAITGTIQKSDSSSSTSAAEKDSGSDSSEEDAKAINEKQEDKTQEGKTQEGKTQEGKPQETELQQESEEIVEKVSQPIDEKSTEEKKND